MEDSYETMNNGGLRDPNLDIVQHFAYELCSKLSLAWFDVRVFYLRISNFVVDDSTPKCLSLTLVPLNPDTLLELNGTGCSIYSEAVSCLVRGDRVDKKSEEATFVSTDTIRLTGSVKFEVFDKENLVLSGLLEVINGNGFVWESRNNVTKWSMNCESVMNAGAGFFKGKQILCSSESLSPTIEVYVAGCFCGTPVILTKSLQLSSAKKHCRKGTLDSIPEYETIESRTDVTSETDLQVTEYGSYKEENEEDYRLQWRRAKNIEGEDGELSWFNDGVRVGVGIGLGICLGVGIGVGLLVRTYQVTTRNFKRQLI